jgi:hypothetical protein
VISDQSDPVPVMGLRSREFADLVHLLQSVHVFGERHGLVTQRGVELAVRAILVIRAILIILL